MGFFDNTTDKEVMSILMRVSQMPREKQELVKKMLNTYLAKEVTP
jgi:hypothetical protein